MSHVVIAGPGRTGTSFTMRWLHACGADTGPETSWHPEARAGFEQRFTPGGPRIQKDPWLWTYVQDMDPRHVDHIVLPVRHLHDIADSRLANERTTIPPEHRHLRDAAVYGRVPGGALYDLSRRTQEDIAARMLYVPIEWAAYHDIAVSLLHHHHIFETVDALWSVFEKEITADYLTASEHWSRLRG